MQWIAMRADLAGDPSTISIANDLDILPQLVTGLLHCLWSWIDAQSHNGHALGVTKVNIDCIVGVTGFADAIEKAGWLVVEKGGITIPNFDNWMSESAKKRLKGAKRKQKERSTKPKPVTKMSHSVCDKSVTREDKITVVKKSTSLLMSAQAEKLYQAYPLKKGKKAAIKAILKALKEKTSEELMAGVQRYVKEVAGSEFIKHPATWFNQGCWDDEADPKNNGKSEGANVDTGRFYAKKDKYDGYE